MKGRERGREGDSSMGRRGAEREDYWGGGRRGAGNSQRGIERDKGRGAKMEKEG